MYSEEIKQLLQLKSELITVKEYLNIITTSPQINCIKYYDNNFYLFTDDNYKFKLKIKR